MRALLVMGFLWPLAVHAEGAVTVQATAPAGVPYNIPIWGPDGSHPTQSLSGTGTVAGVAGELAKYPYTPIPSAQDHAVSGITTDSGGIPVCGEVAGAPACPSPMQGGKAHSGGTVGQGIAEGGQTDNQWYVIEGAGQECRMSSETGGVACESTPGQYLSTPIPAGKTTAWGRVDIIEGVGQCLRSPGAGEICTAGHVVADPEKWEALNKRLDVIEKELSLVQCTLDLTSRGPVASDIIERFCAK